MDVCSDLSITSAASDLVQNMFLKPAGAVQIMEWRGTGEARTLQ